MFWYMIYDIWYIYIYIYIYIVFKRSLSICHIMRVIFSRCPFICHSISKTAITFLNILDSTIDYSLQKKMYTRNFCLFAYFQSCNNKIKFLLIQTLQSSGKMSYLHKSFCTKRWWYPILFYPIPLHIEKALWKNYVRFWKMELIVYTHISPKFIFKRKSNLKFCIIFNMISFTNMIGWNNTEQAKLQYCTGTT